MSLDPTQYTLQLAKTLVDDIEEDRLPVERLLLRAARLARLVGAEETALWLGYESNGYPTPLPKDGSLVPFLTRSGRSAPDGKFYVWSLPEQAALRSACEKELERLRIPDVEVSLSSANPTERVTGALGTNVMTATSPANRVVNRMQFLSAQITICSRIQGRALSALHSFAETTWYELAFSSVAESIFGNHKRMVDELLRATAGSALDKIPAIYNRLAEGDDEAIAQASATCRRVITAFADAVFEPQDCKVDAGQSEPIDVGREKELNRIEAYLYQNCPIKARRERLNNSVRKLWERFCAGTHADITLEEARSSFLTIYVTLGEILTAIRGTA
ncbi:MAG TPA: hypothetical protein VM537_02455 [Anaerolineae bacterium]|nr:hypothetical protein [Anaerolineae bacterium]